MTYPKGLVSFVIPHKGRSEMLRQTLGSIAEQHYPAHLIEIIVVSQTPEIKGLNLLDDNKIAPRVLIRSEEETISTLRNRGEAVAKGEFLAFLDADIVLSPNWISVMRQELSRDKQRLIMSAMQVCDSAAPPLEKIRTSLSNADLDCNVSFLPGRNLFMRRETFEKVGGFPEHLVTCEDYFFTDKAAQIGLLYYTSEASYIHLGEDKVLGEMFKKEIWRGQSNLQSIHGRHIPLREIPSFVLPPLICISFLLALAGMILQLYTLATGFTLLACLPLIIYSARLYSMARTSVSLLDILMFYAVYFPARAIGTVLGLFNTIEADHK